MTRANGSSPEGPTGQRPAAIMTSAPRRSLGLERDVARWAALAVAGLGATVIVGWLLEIEGLKSAWIGTATMKFNTALCFVLSGAALWTRIERRGAGRWGPWLAAAVAAIAAATLLEDVLGIDLGIDQALFSDPHAAAGAAPGRMSAATALTLVLFGAAFVVARGGGSAAKYSFTAFALLGLVVSFLVFVGYVFGTPVLYRPVAAVSIAFHTAIGMLVLFVGLLSIRTDLGLMAIVRQPGAGGAFARWTLPAVLVITPALGWLVLEFGLAGYYDPRLALAIFSIATVVVLTAILWAASRHAARLDDARRSQERLTRAVIAAALDAFILMDRHGRIIEWNAQAERIFGWSRAEALGRTIAETIIPPAQRDAHERGRARFLATGEGPVLNRRNELTAQRRDGTEFPVELIVTPIPVEGGWAFSGFVRDLSMQKQIEASLRQSQKMEAVGQLTGGVAHDFNNLLTVVIGSLDMAADQAAGRARALIETALRAAERGASLTQRLLAFSRRQPLSPAAIDLNELVQGMEDLLRRTLGENIEIQFRPQPALWPAFADRSQVENTLLNLAVNARDAMPGGGRLTIECAGVHLDEAYAALNPEVTPGDYAMLAVTDTGTGMPPEVIERAFEPFFTTKETGKGTGLGLSMIYGFAKQSGGHVKIYSEVGMGTTVRLYLPRADARVSAASNAAAAPSGQPRGGETILVVEDDAEVRALATAHLTELGYRVIAAGDGLQARAILGDTQLRIDLLFTDIVMPGGLTGRQLADEARLTRPRLRALFTSGYAENAIVHQGRLDEGVFFLAKPYRRDELAKKLRAALDAAP
jgi:PAS domain S-box-containing protein